VWAPLEQLRDNLDELCPAHGQASSRGTRSGRWERLRGTDR
jgi:hypothetical protein